MHFDDLENLFAWGLETSGGSSIQTNGVLIEDRHIDLFRRYKVSVGIAIDGPGELNDARWHRGLEKTRQSTAVVEGAIERLCREYEAPGLIITLHKGNATAEKLPIMANWVRCLHGLGIRNVRLHLSKWITPPYASPWHHCTVDNALGFAQALVHEMAHQKLSALGVSIETAERLITNSPSEEFESPIRKDRTRPMSAVFHAQYSFIYVGS